MKLTLELELAVDHDALVHPRVASALVDYANAVIMNNQALMHAKSDQVTALKGDPPVGLSREGVLHTPQGVTVRETRLELDS